MKYSTEEPEILRSLIDYKPPETENLCKFLSDALDKHSDKILLIGGESERKWTGEKIKSTALKFASALVHKFRIKKGQICSIFIVEDDLVPICMIGVLMAGGTFNYLSAEKNTGRELRDTITVLNSKILISTSSSLRRVSELISEQRKWLKVVALDELPEGFSEKSGSLDGLLIDEYNSDTCDTAKPKNLPDWNSIIDNVNDIALIQFSSGTTGKPKPIPRTHKNCCHLAVAVDHEELVDFKPGVIITGSLPLTHRPGIWALFSCIHKGSTIIIWTRLSEVEATFKIVEKYKVTMFSSSLLFLSLLGDVTPETVSKYNMSTLKHMITSGAKILKKSLPEYVVEILKLDTLRQCFGMTESGWVFLIEKSLANDNYLTVGHVCPSMEAKVVDRKTRKMLPANAVGEIALRGPQVFPGYIVGTSVGPSPLLNNRDDFDEDGFFLIGDQGYYNEDGLVFIEGRYKEMLILENNAMFFPSEIEEIIMEHQAVECACVVKIVVKKDSPYDLAKACITVKSGKRVTEKEIIDYVSSQSKDMILSGGVEILTTFPRLQNGKIDKLTLSKSIMR